MKAVHVWRLLFAAVFTPSPLFLFAGLLEVFGFVTNHEIVAVAGLALLVAALIARMVDVIVRPGHWIRWYEERQKGPRA